MFQRYLFVWVVLLSVLAAMWPTWLPGWQDPFVGTQAVHLRTLFAATMFAIGWMLPRDEMRQVIRRWPTVFGGTAVQYTVMPLLAAAVAWVAGFDGDLRVGVIMVGCVPGAMASNVLTLLARGNVSYSVSLTTAATLVSPLVVPLTLWLALGRSVPPERMADIFFELCLIVVLPVLAGMLLSRLRPGWDGLARRFGPVIANLTILWIIAVVVGKNRAGLAELEVVLLAALLIINVGGYFAGWGGAALLGLSARKRRALVLEVGMQNAGLGSVLATTYFATEAALPPALYTFGCMFTGTLLAQFWARRAAQNEGSEAIRDTG